MIEYRVQLTTSEEKNESNKLNEPQKIYYPIGVPDTVFHSLPAAAAAAAGAAAASL